MLHHVHSVKCLGSTTTCTIKINGNILQRRFKDTRTGDPPDREETLQVELFFSKLTELFLERGH